MVVAIYCRLSREDEDKLYAGDDSESIQNQKSMLINYAIENSWDIYNIYCDEDYSGIDSERPEFNRLIEDAEKHKFDIVLCKTQSRFTRDMEVVEKYLHNKFILWNIRFISLVDHVDTEDKGNKKSRQINGLVNEWYLEDLSENIKKTFDNKRKQGLHIGSFVCYGYKRDKENKNKIIIDEDVKDVIQLIFNLYEQGNGVTKIAQMLNNKKILTPTKYKLSKGLKFYNQGKNIECWSKSTVSSILKNEMYIGNMVQGYNRKISYKNKKAINIPKNERIIVQNTHEAIISKEQFYNVQKILKSKTRRCKNGKAHLFASKLVCLDCGSKLHKCKNDRGYVYFSCKSAKKIYGKCSSHSIGYENLKKIIAEKIKEKILTYYDFNNISDDLFKNKNDENKLKLLYKRKENLIKDMDKINKAIKELYINKVSKKISENAFEELNESFLKDKSKKQDEINQIKKELKILKEKEQSSKYINKQKEKIINKFKNIEELSYDIVNSFIDYIEIGKKKLENDKLKTDNKTYRNCKSRYTQDVVIHWNF